MPDSPIGYTTYYGISKWADNATPGASALNNNWDLIDTAINSASVTSILNVTVPLYQAGGNLQLLYNTTNLKVTSNQLNTIQDISSGSSPTFNNLTVSGSLTVGSFSLNNIVGNNLYLTGSITASAGIFDQIILRNPATTVSQSVRADRTLTMRGPLFGTGNLTSDRTISLIYDNKSLVTQSIDDVDTLRVNYTPPLNLITDYYLGLDYVSSNFKLTTGQLNTIQDIYSGSTPTFNQVYLTSQATSTNETVRADRIVSASGVLKGGGNLTADRNFTITLDEKTITTSVIDDLTSLEVKWTAPLYITPSNYLGLDYNTSNLKMTTGQIDTIQDIHTGSSPQFVNLKLTGQISSSGTSNNYLIGKTNFGQAKAGAEVINLYGNLNQSGSFSLYNNFSSGWAGSGWRIDKGITYSGSSHIETDNLTVRGALRVYELIINQIRATNGTLIVTSAAKVSASVNIDPGLTDNVTFENPEGNNFCPFMENDIVISQTLDLNSGSLDLVKRIVRRVATVSGRTCALTIDGDLPIDTGTIDVGDVFARIGNTTNTTRQGVVYITSDDSNAPFLDVVDNVDSWADWVNKTKLKVRLGKLSGITDDVHGSLNGYGLYTNRMFLSSGENTTDGISMLVDSGSAQFYMKRSGANVFDFDTATATAHIAGWTIDATEIYTTSASVDAVSLNATNKSVGVNNDRVKMYNTNGSNWGLSGSGFHLGSTNNIAGWIFDTTKLYNGTDIVLDASNKKVSVYADKVKMFYTATNNYGISGSGFQLGSTNNIAGWTFTTSQLSSPTYASGGSGEYKYNVKLTASPTIVGVHVQLDEDVVGNPAYLSFGSILNQSGTPQERYGISFIESTGTYFELSNSIRQIAGWNFDTEKLYKGTDIVLSTNATTKKVSVYNDRVKMYYTDANNYGVSASGFHLGSTNTIAGYTFTKNLLRAEAGSSAGVGGWFKTSISPENTMIGTNFADTATNNARLGFALDFYKASTALGHVSIGQLYNGAYTDVTMSNSYGIEMNVYRYGPNTDNNVIFRLGQNISSSALLCSIAGWNFDYSKMWGGSNTAGIVLSTSASAFLSSTGTGFEVYNPASPKFVIGNKAGHRVDWNITNANSLTISGSIIGSTFSTDTMGEVSGSISSYASIYKTSAGSYPVIAANYYVGVGNNTAFYVSPASSTTVMSWERLLTAGAGANATFKLNYTTTSSSGSWELLINDKKLTRTHTRGTTEPTSDLKQGDSWYNSGTGLWHLYDTSDGWIPIPNI